MARAEKTEPVPVCLDADVLIAGLLSRTGSPAPATRPSGAENYSVFRVLENPSYEKFLHGV